MKVGLIWHNFESDNLGVGALSVGNLSLIKRAVGEDQKLRVCVIGARREGNKKFLDEMASYFDISIEHRVVTFFSLFCSLVSKNNRRGLFYDLDLAFDISEGDSFTDIYGWKRMLKMAVSKFAVARVCPLVISPQTIGPFRSQWATILAKYVLKRATLAYVRDSKSEILAKKLGVTVRCVPDVAFAMPFEQKSIVKSAKTVGVNVSGLLINGGYNSQNQFGLEVDYFTLIEKLLSQYNQLGLEIYLVSHVISDKYEIEDDYRACLKLKEKYPFVNVAPKFRNPIEAKSFISGLDVFVGSRMHATIAAFGTGVPVLCLAYSRKFEGVFGDLDYHKVINLYESREADILKEAQEFGEGFESLVGRIYEGNNKIKIAHKAFSESMAGLINEIKKNR